MRMTKSFKFSARLILVPIVMILQLGLTVCSVVFSVFGGIGELIGSIVGIVLIARSLLCRVMGILEGPLFWEMFLGGVAFKAIPEAINKISEEGIEIVKGILYALVF